MKSWITDSEGMLGAIEKQAKHVSKVWYNNTKRRETAALWEQRQDVNNGCVVPMSELRAQVAEAVRARRMRKAKTRTNQKYLGMSRKQLESFLEQERRRRRKGNSQTGKRFLKSWPDATGNAPRNAKSQGSLEHFLLRLANFLEL